MPKTVICSHGFGVKADARGMFTEIAETFPEFTFKMFDYNEVLPNGDTIVAPLIKQAEILQKHIDEANDAETLLLCHSQGSLVAGLANLSKISKVILLAPPVIASEQRVIDKLLARSGSEINVEGMSKYPRTDGSTAYLTKEYIYGFRDMNPLQLYKSIADQVPIIILRATNDERLGLTNVDEVTNARLIDVAADHDFTGNSRSALIDVLKGIL